ncbi:hypothetical protein MASR2M15_28940 [Anaerolineales bacterium]
MEMLARKLMMLTDSNAGNASARAIFGASNKLEDLNSNVKYRVGLWPLISQENPELAMGLWSVLALFLDMNPDSRVYRIFSILEGDPEAFSYEIGKSQFTPDTWGIDELDDNIAIWGALESQSDQLSLNIWVENDLKETSFTDSLTYLFDNLLDFYQNLANISVDILKLINDEDATDFTISDLLPYSPNFLNKDLLISGFYWELNFLLSTWGKDWEDEEIIKDFFALKECMDLTDNSDNWIFSRYIQRAFLPSFSYIGEILTPYIPTLIEEIDNPLAQWNLATVFRNLGNKPRAYDYFQRILVENSENTYLYRSMLAVCLEDKFWSTGVEYCQNAIKNQINDAIIFEIYARLLLNLQEINQALLIEAEGDNDFLYEAIESLFRAIEIKPRKQSLVLLANLLLEQDSDRFWEVFERLVIEDQAGKSVLDIIDKCYSLDDLSTGYEILHRYVTKDAHNPHVYIALACLALIDESEHLVKPYLDKASDHVAADDQATKDEIERLLLEIKFVDFEVQLGEIIDQLGSDKILADSQLDFLEAVLEEAPRYEEAYLLLANAYTLDKDAPAALEVIQDGIKNLPESASIVDLYAQLVWEHQDQEEALEILLEACENFPLDASIFARTGLYLFQLDQIDQSRFYLSRAEVLSPENAVVRQARLIISKSMR